MPVSAHYQPALRVPDLGEPFFDVVEPACFPEHVLRFRNQRWADRIGLGTLTAEEWRRHFAAFEPLPENLREPLALRYHGHQFLVYNPLLGDGRGFLFAQLLDPVDGRLLDLSTKGSGRTPWSRGGDGRLTLKGGVREILATEMLEAFGVDTSKSFSLFETGEALERGDEPSPTRSSVLVRLSHSHVRFGTFQRLAYHGDREALRRLLDFTIAHYVPVVEGREDTVTTFVREVGRRSAFLVASWMVAGFVHGVLNSDNMNVTGESFDYGPWRFLPEYDPRFVAAYFDYAGVYRFGRQPQAVLWNLERLVDALSLLAPRERLARGLEPFESDYREFFRRAFLERLGVRPEGPERDDDLVAAALDFLSDRPLGYDRLFFDWYGGPVSTRRAMEGPAAGEYRGEPFEIFRRWLDSREPSAPGRLDHPYFSRRDPCTMGIDDVEALWDPIARRDDWTAFERKLADVREMAQAHGRSEWSIAPSDEPGG